MQLHNLGLCMDDFTKIKLINSLIDVVARFYELKNASSPEEAMRLKGFCEGMAYTLIELDSLSEEEASKILKGLGKKEELPLETPTPELDLPMQEEIFKPQQNLDNQNNLDIPTFIRKK